MNWDFLTHNYLTRGFWGDEAWTAGISRLSIREIITVTGQDFHPPFYYFIVHFFAGPFDFREVPVRLISTFFFLTVPVLTYFLTQKFWATKERPSKFTSLITALLVLFAPIMITYAFEARSYGLLACESVLSAYIFWHAKDEAKGRYGWRLAYLALGGAMVYTHYYAWFILVSHAVYLLAFDRKRILPMLPAALGILLIQLPWLPTMLHQTGSVKDSYWIGQINEDTHKEFFYRVTGGDVVTPFQKPLGLIIGYTILIGFFASLFRRKLTDHHKFLYCWLLVPTLIPTAISFAFAPVFFYRYLIFSAIPLLILTVQAVRDQFIKPWVLLALALTIGFMELKVDWKIFTNYPRSMRETVAELYSRKLAGDGPVYTVLPSFAEVLYYVGDRDPIIVEPLGLIQFSGKSLLDMYVSLGKVTIAEPQPLVPHWFLGPEKVVERK